MKSLHFNWSDYLLVGLKHPRGNADELSVSLRGLSGFKTQTAFKVLEVAHPAKPSTALEASFWQTRLAHRRVRDGARSAAHLAQLDETQTQRQTWWGHNPSPLLVGRKQMMIQLLWPKAATEPMPGTKPHRTTDKFSLSWQGHFSWGLWRKGKPWPDRRVLKQVCLLTELLRLPIHKWTGWWISDKTAVYLIANYCTWAIEINAFGVLLPYERYHWS